MEEQLTFELLKKMCSLLNKASYMDENNSIITS